MNKHPEAKRVENGVSILREWQANERCWSSPVTDDDGPAAGNIVRDEVQVVAIGGGSLGWTHTQRRRSVAINQNFVAHGQWKTEELTWSPT
jgi:hypothetical protein